MSKPPAAPLPQTAPLGDSEIEGLARLLQGLPAPLEPLDVSGLDGYLCGTLLRATPLAPSQWHPGVLDIEGRAPPAAVALSGLMTLAERRRLELDRAIHARQWFDPWVFEVDDAAVSPAQQVQPWVSGLTLALERFPGSPGVAHPAAREPLAVLYGMFDAHDLDDVDELSALIEELEPPADLSQAVEDLVRSVLLLADVVRPPQRLARRPQRRARRGP